MWLFKKNKNKSRKNDTKTKTRKGSVPARDELTGVLSLPKFCEDAAVCIREYPGTSFAFCCTAVGNIAEINSKFGKPAGDKVLQETARVLTSYSNDMLVARAGDKFMLMTKYEDEKQLDLWIAQLHENLKNIGKILPEQPHVYMHSGIFATEGRLIELTAEEMLDRAKIAEAEAAKRTHSSYIFYSAQLGIAAEQEKLLERDMKTALEQKQFNVFVQPRFDIKTDKIIGGKLMSTWMHPQLGNVAAYRYIPLFVKNGFIIDLDIYMLEQTCMLIRSIIDDGKQPMRMSLNVPRIFVTEADKYVPVYTEMKKSYDIPDGLIELEFSERLINAEPKLAASVINRVKECGFLCAVENFGSGTAATETITDFNLDTVKFSRDIFEDDVISDKENEIITRIVETAHSANMTVAATGVPDSLIPTLAELGCDIVQGKLSQPPLSLEEIKQIL